MKAPCGPHGSNCDIITKDFGFSAAPSSQDLAFSLWKVSSWNVNSMKQENITLESSLRDLLHQKIKFVETNLNPSEGGSRELAHWLGDSVASGSIEKLGWVILYQ